MGCIARSARSYHPARTLDEVDKQGRSDLPSVRFVRSVRDNIHRTCLRVFSEICVRFIISLFFLCKVTNPHKHHRKENRRKRHLRRKLSNFLTLFGCSSSNISRNCVHLYAMMKESTDLYQKKYIHAPRAVHACNFLALIHLLYYQLFNFIVE